MSQDGPNVKEIFVAALDHEPGPVRASFLDEACRDDAELRLRVDVLLRAHERARDVLGPIGKPGDESTVADTSDAESRAALTATLTADQVSTAADATAGEFSAQSEGAGDATVGQTGGAVGNGLHRGDHVRYFGDYEIFQELGRGGMGVVYLARQVTLNRQVALKMIRAGVLAGDVELRRFQNEAEAVAQLDHPGIVPVYEVGEHLGQKYFSMKLVGGASLAERLDEFKTEPQAAARLVALAADAVHHAHLRGILHRDLKPANILIDDQGRPNVTDFGLARKVEGDSELTQSGAILGTPAYMAPEQASGRRRAVTTAGDVYGLGAILYALLTGRAPFGGDSVVETLDAVRARPPEPPSKLNGKLPKDLEIVCLKCLEKDPQRRYTSAQAFAEDLRRHLAGEPIMARPVGSAERAWLWCRRNKRIAALSALLIASLIAGTVFSVAFAFHARDESRRASAAAGLANQEAVRANQQADDARRQRDLSERLRYIAEINLAQRDWDASNVDLARSRLADLAPRQSGATDPRGWEWFYLDATFQPELRVFPVAKEQTWSVAFAPDGRTLASAGDSGILRLWNVVSGHETATFRGHKGRVQSVAFSLDGHRLASGGDDGTVRLWDIDSGRETAALRGHNTWVTCVTFSPDGRILASSGEDGTVRIWNAISSRETAVHRVHETSVHRLAFSPDGKTLATATVAANGGVRLWDVATGREAGVLRGHNTYTYSVAFAPGSRVLASADGDGTIRVWDVVSGLETATLRGHQGRIWSIAFAPDGRVLASAGYDGAVRLWDVTTGREAGVLRGHQPEVYSVSFAPDGRLLATAGTDGAVRMWDSLAGREFAASRGNQGDPWSLAVAPDGRSIASINGDGVVRLWDVASERHTRTLAVHRVRVTGYQCSVKFSPDGRVLATTASVGDGAVRLWDVATGRETATLRGHRDGVHQVAFSPRGDLLASAGNDESVRLWDVASGRESATLRGHKGWVMNVAFSPDGRRIASAGDDATVRLWDVATGRETATLRGHDGRVMCVAFTPDGKNLASGSESVRLWDVASGRELAILRGHGFAVCSIAFAPDGRRLASGSWDGTVRLWDLASRREAAALRGHNNSAVWSVAFSADGRTLVSGGGDKIQTWVAAPLNPERRSHREALNLVRFAIERSSGSADLRDRIRRDGTIAEDVRNQALELVDGHWEAHVHDQAESLIVPLFGAGLLRDEVEKALRTKAGLDSEVRARALELSQSWPESSADLNEASWSLASDSGRDSFDYLLALRRAEAACRYDPDYGNFLNTLGLAQYRAGRYPQALDTLTRSTALNGGRQPADMAFLAMTRHRLGQSQPARQTLAHVRAAIASGVSHASRMSSAAEDAAFLREAEVLIELDPAFPTDPFAP